MSLPRRDRNIDDNTDRCGRSGCGLGGQRRCGCSCSRSEGQRSPDIVVTAPTTTTTSILWRIEPMIIDRNAINFRQRLQKDVRRIHNMTAGKGPKVVASIQLVTRRTRLRCRCRGGNGSRWRIYFFYCMPPVIIIII